MTRRRGRSSLGRWGCLGEIFYFIMDFHLKLQRVFEEDQVDREENLNWDHDNVWKGVQKRDEARRKEVLNILKEYEDSFTAIDFYHAAMIFQHGSGIEDFRRANDFAKRSMNMGYEKAKWLYAASFDRFLVHSGRMQKFGTQYRRNKEGILELLPVDPKTTNDERAKYNVPVV